MLERKNELVLDGSLDGASEQRQAMSMMNGATVGPEGIPDAADLDMISMKSGRSFNHGTLLLLMVFVIAAGTIWAMRMSQGELTLSSATKQLEAKVEAALSKLSAPNSRGDAAKSNLNKLFQDTDQIVAVFSDDPATHQVPISHVQKNPFYIHIRRELPKTKDTPKGPSQEELERNRKLTMLEKEFDSLKLQSVIDGGRTPVAVINGELLQTGEVIGSFRIKSIQAKLLKVELVNPLKSYTLKMDTRAENDPRRRR
jgi:hypothetical protein